jgi:hypothetical protein
MPASTQLAVDIIFPKAPTSFLHLFLAVARGGGMITWPQAALMARPDPCFRENLGAEWSLYSKYMR